jgi:hypothetical protein
MTRKIIKRGVVLAAACIAATGAVTAVADQTPPEADEFGPPDKAAVGAVQWAQAQRIGELRRARSSDDDLPQEWRERLERHDGSERWGSNPGLARRAAPGVWLIPGDGFVCLANITPRDRALGFGCATPAHVEQGLLQPADLDAQGRGVLTGVMADGVESVTLVDQDGSRRDVAVARNVYRAAVDAEIKEVRWTDALGVERVRPMGWDAP